MKKLAIILTVVLAVVLSGGLALALQVTLPNGQTISLDSLPAADRQNMISYIDKISKAQEKAKKTQGTVVEVLKNADPTALNEWRKLITGTIKDVANDLNVSVNEFLTTPAGMGVAALIIYKVAGKEIISDLIDILLAIPLWIIVMSILWYLQRQYLTSIVVYDKITETELDDGKKQVVKSDPQHSCKYDWDSSDARTVFSCFLYGSMILITITCIALVFA